MSGPYGLELVDCCSTCTLRREHFFCALPPEVLRDFQTAKYTSAYPSGAALFVEGERSRGVHVLCQGEVKLSVTSLDGRRLILRVAQPGEILGLNACISGEPHDVTAETQHPSQTDFVKREDFLRFLRQHGEACLQAALHLSHQCNKTQDVIRSMGRAHSAREKLARLILTRGESSQGKIFRLGLSHEEISEVIGTSRETVTRMLAEFARERLIFKTRQSLRIRDRANLERLCRP